MEGPISPNADAITQRMWDSFYDRLLPAAKAARNQMFDAGMKHGADALAEAIFEFEAIRGELSDEIRKAAGGPL